MYRVKYPKSSPIPINPAIIAVAPKISIYEPITDLAPS